MKKLFTLLILLSLWVGNSWAQVNLYTFASTVGTYSPVTSGTQLIAALTDDGSSVATNIGFNFTFNGTTFTQFVANSNGSIRLGSSAPTSAYSPISTTSNTNAIAFFARDGKTGGAVVYAVTGSEPNRILTIEYPGFYPAYGSTTTYIDAQIKLYETTNVVELIYGNSTRTTSYTAQLGMRGGTATTDFNNRTTTTDWAATTAGSASNASMTLSSTVFPVSGTTFTFTPPTPCIAPVSQPTALLLTPLTTSVSGSFTAAAGSDSYLIVRSTDATLTTPPVDGTAYAAGAVLGNGTVVYAGASTSFAASGLTGGTLYYFHVFSMNSVCSGGPLYLTTLPLEGSTTTLPNPPASMTATAISGAQIDLTTIANVAGNDIMIAWNTVNTFGTPTGTYNTNDPITGGGTVLNTGAAGTSNHVGLSQGIQYYYRAWSIAGGQYSSTTVSANAITLCSSAYTAPYSDNFDGLQDPGPCWTEAKGQLLAPTTLTGTTSLWFKDDWRNITGTGDKAAGINIYSTARYEWLFTPQIDLGSGTYQLDFDLTLNAFASSNPPGLTGTDDRFAVVISTDGGTTWTSANTLRLWDNAGSSYVYNNINPNGEHVTLSLAGYTGIIKIGFYGESTVSNADNDLMVNNVVIQLPPSCPPPAVLLAVPAGFQSSLSWTETGTATLWDIEWGPAGFTQGTGTTITGVTNPYVLTGLTPETPYAYYVRANCGSGNYSAWTGPKTFTTGLACPAPTAQIVTGITTSAANLGWTESGLATSWDIEWGPAGFTPGTGTTVTGVTNPYLLSGLTANSSYAFYVRAYCDVTYQSTWSGPKTFNTACDAVTAFNENFDGVTTPALPGCWEKVGTSGSAYTQTTSPSSAPNCMYIYGSSGSMPVVAMPKVSNAGAGTYQLRFKLRANFTVGEAIQIGYMTDRSSDVSFVPVASVTASTLTYIEYIVNLGTAPGANTTIAFRHPALLGYSCLIDDVIWEPIPACPFPSALTAVPAGFQATLGWTENGTATLWDIEWGPSGFTQGTGTTITGVTNNPYILTGLNPVTPYAYYARANCGSGNYSAWTGPKTFTTTVACPAPTLLTAVPTAPDKADLGWTETGTATLWNIEYGPTGFAQGTGTIIPGVTENPFTLSGLASGTSYGFYVQADCGGGSTSLPSGPKNFATLCDVVNTYPWTEGFESVTIPAIPVCMSMSAGAGYTTANDASSTYDADAHTGAKFLRDAWSATNEYIWTPGFNLTASTSYDFSFWWAGDEYDSWDGEVFYNTSPTDVGAIKLGNSFITSGTMTTYDYAQAIYQLTPTAAGTYYLAIRVNEPTGGPWYLSFDDFRFEPTPLCSMPLSLTATPLSTTTAEVAWTGATTVQFDYGTIGHAAGTGTITSSTSTNPFTLNGLTASTQYDLFVRQDCGGGEYSSWFGPVTFATLCDIAALPFTESFAGANIPVCWSQTFSGGVTSNRWSVSTTNVAGGSANEMKATYLSGTGISRLVTPAFNTTGVTNLLVSFKHFFDDFGAGITYKVQTSTDGVTWSDTPWTFASGNGDASGNVNISVTTNLGGTTYLAFVLDGDHYQFDYWFIDDLNIAVQPAVDLALTDIYQTSSSLAPSLAGNDYTVSVDYHSSTINSTFGPGTISGQSSNVNNTTLLPNDITSSGSKYPVTPVNIEALLTNNGYNASTYTLNLAVDGVAQTPYSGPSVTANGGTHLASLTYTPTARGTFITSGSVTAAGDPIASNNDNSFRMRVYPDVFTRTIYDLGTNVVSTNVGWGAATPAFKAGVRYTATAATKLAGVDFIYNTEAIAAGTITVQVRAAGTTTGAPGAVLYTQTYSTSAYFPSTNDYITFAFGDDAPTIASGEDYWITILMPTGILYPGAAQSGAITTGHSYYEQSDGVTWSALVLSSVEYAWIMRAINTVPVVNKTMDVNVFLEGPYGTGPSMSTTLNPSQLPLAQPYTGAPWNYTGTESVTTMPAGIVDWVLVDLRDAATPAAALPATSLSGWPKAFLLNSDGKVVALDGTSLPDIGNPTVTNNLFVVVRHRNHIAVMSANGMDLSPTGYSYDFSTALTQAYNGSAGYKLIATDVYGMVTGDADADGSIFSSDYNQWASKYNTAGYLNSDFDMDINVYSSDYNKWAANYNKGNPISKNVQPFIYRSQVPGDVK
jgi:hypothetical protein